VTDPWNVDALWIKARLFINRSMDDDREFEEQAFWASASLELLGKAALSRVSPMLIAHPNDDGHSILIASGAVDYSDTFASVQAKAIWSRCARMFRPFNETEAKKIAAGRNEYIHSVGVGFDKIPQAQWWPRYWAQAFILVEHLNKSITEFVGAKRSVTIEAHLQASKKYRAQRLATLVGRALSQKQRHEAGTLSAPLEASWQRFTHVSSLYTDVRSCPACGSDGRLGGDDVVESHVDVLPAGQYDPDDRFFDPRVVTLEVAPDAFSCRTCHLIIDDIDLLEEAGLDKLFEAEGDLDTFFDFEGPEYENE
jgi:hypothetical protein